MVDYWKTDIVLNPQCPHGPTLLFSRKGNNRRFYACSAFRDRKNCPFFLWDDEVDKKKVKGDNSFNELISKFSSHRKVVQNLRNTSKKTYCCTCEKLISSKTRAEHYQHNVNDINDDTLRYPTLVMKPKQESKAESQFHFAKSTINTMFNFLRQLKVSAVICIGCPTIHEFIINESQHIQSILLDIDIRYLQFFEPDVFQVFNMFNCHMFDPNGWKHIETLSNKGKIIAVIVDPPFGGRMEPLAYTLNRLINILQHFNESTSKLHVIVLLILPYFMEPMVKESLPDFSMLDYKVEYTNHRQFKKRAGSDRGSAVRIFTNVSSCLFVLPEEEGYKLCDLCERWVCKENKHCFKCEACTSKNGRPYRHCNRCCKCVKDTWKHCFKCGICKLPEHICKKEEVKQMEKEEERKIDFKKRKFRVNKTQSRKK